MSVERSQLCPTAYLALVIPVELHIHSAGLSVTRPVNISFRTISPLFMSRLHWR